jgi:hypothetical protein
MTVRNDRSSPQFRCPVNQIETLRTAAGRDLPRTIAFSRHGLGPLPRDAGSWQTAEKALIRDSRIAVAD